MVSRVYFRNHFLGILCWFSIATIGVLNISPENLPQILVAMSMELVIANALAFMITLFLIKVLAVSHRLLKIVIIVTGVLLLTMVWGVISGLIWQSVFEIWNTQEFHLQLIFESLASSFILQNESWFTLSWVLNTVLVHVFFIVTLVSISLATWFRESSIKEEEELQRVKNEEKDALMEMLRKQVNPHFLFNSLNTIHALIDDNQEEAKNFIDNVHDYYQIVLQKDSNLIPLREEIGAVKKYLQILKVRFEVDLEYSIVYEEKNLSTLIPSYVILLLVENAFKHGLRSNDDALQIEIIAKSSAQDISVSVINTGHLKTSPGSNGLGIKNVQKRLKQYYGDSSEFGIHQHEDKVIASILIPTRMQENAA